MTDADIAAAPLDLAALESLARKIDGAPFGATVNLTPGQVLKLIAAARERDALKAKLAVSEKALVAAAPWVEAGPLGSWRDGVLDQIAKAIAAIQPTQGETI